MKNNPVELQINFMLDMWVYSMLYWHFLPFRLMSRGTELEQWISKFSTNGIKNFNICQ